MLETNRLLLRPFTKNDIDAVFAMRSDRDVMRFIRPIQTNRSEAESWINLVSSRWQDERIGFCAVIEKSSNQFIGWCGLWRLKENNETEIGYALIKKFRGQNYAVEAAERFLSYGFEDLKLEEIVAVTRPENRASWRTMEKIGMTYDYTGSFYDSELVHYSITQKEFFQRKDAEAQRGKEDL
jgi:ribosomal-protein-alanine N-acetyltransferase